MSEVLQTLEGWYVLHDFRQIDWNTWKTSDVSERAAALEELNQLIEEWNRDQAEKKGSFGCFQILGHKADLLFLHFRPNLKELAQLESRLNKSKIAEYLTPSYSYLSVVELSNYVNQPGVDPETDPYIQGRLKPALPNTQHICFYPMNKKREGNDNWYMLPVDERRTLMRSHGMIGRTYAGRVTQIVSGSVGLDDWEWGVTLFSDDPVVFKKMIYEMRFDEVSARYGEFGTFLVGNRLLQEDIRSLFEI